MIPEWTLADRLRKARISAGLEQVQLAELLGAARTSVINYESGRTCPRPYMVREWARLTNVPANWLLEGAQVTGESLQPRIADVIPMRRAS